VLDDYSRSMVSWAVGQQKMAGLVIQALNMAPTAHKPHGVIHHSGQVSVATAR
jgi:putative transposase